jgi:ATP-dependent exoDNAse (exonuclease V) beta subunit
MTQYLEQLEYEPDDICVLSPRSVEMSRISAALAEEGVETLIVTDRDFQFSTAGAVRLSTLHSSKGLDFPVVLVFLPALNRHNKFDDTTTERLLRNLVYVGCTRAVENLSVFACPNEDPILADLCNAIAPPASDNSPVRSPHQERP